MGLFDYIKNIINIGRTPSTKDILKNARRPRWGGYMPPMPEDDDYGKDGMLFGAPQTETPLELNPPSYAETRESRMGAEPFTPSAIDPISPEQVTPSKPPPTRSILPSERFSQIANLQATQDNEPPALPPLLQAPSPSTLTPGSLGPRGQAPAFGITPPTEEEDVPPPPALVAPSVISTANSQRQVEQPKSAVAPSVQPSMVQQPNLQNADLTTAPMQPRLGPTPVRPQVSTAQTSVEAPQPNIPFDFQGRSVILRPDGKHYDVATGENVPEADVAFMTPANIQADLPTPAVPRVAPAPPPPNRTLKFNNQYVTVKNNQLVDQYGQPVGSLLDALKDPVFARDYTLQDIKNREEAAIASGKYTATDRATFNREREQAESDFLENRPPDKKRGIKDFFKGLGLGALAGFAQGGIGGAIGGALAGGVGTIINPDVDERLADMMFRRPRQQARLAAAVEAEKTAIAADKARTDALKESLQTEKLVREIGELDVKALKARADVRKGIIDAYGPKDRPLTEADLQVINAKLAEIGEEPLMMEPGESLGGGVKMTYKGVVGTYYANSGQFVPGFVVNADGKRVPLLDPLQQLRQVTDRFGRVVATMTEEEYGKLYMKDEKDRLTAIANMEKQFISEQRTLITKSNAAIVRLQTEDRKLADSLALYETEARNNEAAIAAAEEVKLRVINKGNPEDPTAVWPENQWSSDMIKARAEQDKIITRATNRNAILQTKVDTAEARRAQIAGELAEQQEINRTAAEILKQDNENVPSDYEVSWTGQPDANGVGSGSLIDVSGAQYEGGLKKSGEAGAVPHGKGVMMLPGGAQYEGNFTDGQMNGQGIYRFADGRVYEGNFVNNAFSGEGAMTYAGGARYSGNFVNDVRSGFGTMTFPGGLTFAGTFVDDRPTTGTITAQDGGKYVGGVKTGDKYAIVLHGVGTAYNPDGTIKRRGLWQNGVYAPQQTSQLTYGKYTGQILNDQPEGLGRLEYTDGDIAEGIFENGDLRAGKMTKSTEAQEGLWATDTKNLLLSEGTITATKPVPFVFKGKWTFNPEGTEYKTREGRLEFPDGRVFSGTGTRSKNNIWIDKGTMTYPDGRKEEGTLNNYSFTATPLVKKK